MGSEEIEIGDLFWDKNRVYEDTVNACYLVLSADQEGDKYLYRCSFFMWIQDSGYCGAHERKFTEKEVLEMRKAGNISQIKSFMEEKVE